MKNLFYGIALLITFPAMAQKTISLKLTGIKPEIEQKMINGDIIPSGFGYNNIMLRMKNTDQKGWTLNSGKIYDVVFDPVTRHYTMNVTFTINESKFYSLDKPVVIVITIQTVYGNSIWTQFSGATDALPKTVTLDNYNAVEADAKRPALKSLQMYGKDIPPALRQKMAPDDALATKGNNVLLRIRYQDSKEWIVDRSFAHNDQMGRFWTKFALPVDFEIQRPFIVQAGVKTKFGNVFWGQLLRNKDNNSKNDVIYSEYSGKIDDASAKLSKKMEVIQSTASNATDDNTTPIIGTVNSAPAISAVSNSSASGSKVVLGQQRATIMVDKKPDSLVDRNVRSMLTSDAKVMIGFQEVVLKSGTEITYNPKQGYASAGTSAKEQTLKLDNGVITIKENSKIEFHKSSVKSVLLAKESSLTTSIGEISFGPSGTLYDLLFDEDGDLMGGVTAKEFSFNAGSIPVTLPAQSTIVFRNKKLNNIDPSTDFQIAINGTSYTVSGSNDGPAIFIDRKSGAIEELIIGRGHSITIEGVAIPIKEQSKLSFDFENNQYILTRFYVAQPVTVKEYGKKGKFKDVEVKEGRSLTIKEGKVTDVGR